MHSVPTVYDVEVGDIVLQAPKPTAESNTVRIFPLRIRTGAQAHGLRFQLGDPRKDPWLQLHHSGTVRAYNTDSPQSLCVEAILACPAAAQQLHRVEQQVIDLFVQQAPQWLPTMPHLNDMRSHLDQIWQPLVETKKIRGEPAMSLNLTVHPWDKWGEQETRIICVDGSNKPVRKGDVTDLVADSEVFPIVQLSAVVCKARLIRLSLVVTDLLVKLRN